jgi:hypothetical protein
MTGRGVIEYAKDDCIHIELYDHKKDGSVPVRLVTANGRKIKGVLKYNKTNELKLKIDKRCKHAFLFEKNSYGEYDPRLCTKHGEKYMGIYAEWIMVDCMKYFSANAWDYIREYYTILDVNVENSRGYLKYVPNFMASESISDNGKVMITK